MAAIVVLFLVAGTAGTIGRAVLVSELRKRDAAEWRALGGPGLFFSSAGVTWGLLKYVFGGRFVTLSSRGRVAGRLLQVVSCAQLLLAAVLIAFMIASRHGRF